MKYRIGFIGTGAMGRSHLKMFHASLPDRAECAVVCDPHPPSLKAARQVAPDAMAIDRPDELWAADLDAVVISTPNSEHADLAIAALEAGLHVMCEKPVATTVEDCRRLVAASDRSDRVMMIGHEYRHSIYFKRIKELVQAGEIGQPRLAWAQELRAPFLKKVDAWILDPLCSGGTLVEKNCHHFDLINWWVGANPARVCAFGRNDVLDGKVMDHATVSFEYENGISGSLLLSMLASYRGHDHFKTGVCGADGLIMTSLSSDEVLLWKHDKPNGGPITHRVASEFYDGDRHHGFVEEHTAFLDAMESGKPSGSDVRDCVAGTLLGIAAEQSIREGAAVHVARVDS